MKRVVVAFLLCFGSTAMAQAAQDKARLARTMWSAFQCGTYAEMSGNDQEQARLFELGVKSGREFLEALKNRKIPPQIAEQEVPIGVSMLLGGPSVDFIIGRVFENAMGDAYKEITRDEKGSPDKELRISRAKAKYLTANCMVLR